MHCGLKWLLSKPCVRHECHLLHLRASRGASRGQRTRAWAQGMRRWVQGLSLHPRVPPLLHQAGQCRELCLQQGPRPLGWCAEEALCVHQVTQLLFGSSAHSSSASGHGHFRLYCSPEPLHWLITSLCWPDFLYTQSGPQCRDIPLVATFCGSIWTAQFLNFSNFHCCFHDQSTIFFLFDLSQEWCQ